MPIRVAVVDGDTLTRYGLRELIARHPDLRLAAECGSAAGASAMVRAHQPDVVTVDVALPDGDGLRLARELRDRYSGLGIVMLTSQGQDDVLFRALETGASAFVAKTAPLDEVLAAIRHAAVAASSFTASGLAMALARRRSPGLGLGLSARETQTLRLLRDGLSIPAIAQTLFISHSTAKTYVTRLYRKLGAANRTQALITALHLGLIEYEQPRAFASMPAGPAPARSAGLFGHPGAAAGAARSFALWKPAEGKPGPVRAGHPPRARNAAGSGSRPPRGGHCRCTGPVSSRGRWLLAGRGGGAGCRRGCEGVARPLHR